MKILFFSKYSRMGASSRYRTFQFLKYYEKKGLEVSVQYLLGDWYLKNIYSLKNDKMFFLKIINSYLKRLFFYKNLSKYDLFVIEKELFPWLPIMLEKFFISPKQKTIGDYDDAVFHRYEKNIFLRQKIFQIMEICSAVIVGNEYLANFAKKYNKRVFIIPTVVELEKYTIKKHYNSKLKPVIIGWIGTPNTAKYLKSIIPVLKEVLKNDNYILKCVGVSKNFKLPGIRVENIIWSEKDEANIIKNFDIGIMPLTNDNLSRGKCGLKLLQYMACGIPVVASPVGVNKQIVLDGKNGFLAKDNNEWVNKIKILAMNPNIRNNFGEYGRELVSNKFSIETVLPKLLNIFEQVLKS